MYTLICSNNSVKRFILPKNQSVYRNNYNDFENHLYLLLPDVIQSIDEEGNCHLFRILLLAFSMIPIDLCINVYNILVINKSITHVVVQEQE